MILPLLLDATGGVPPVFVVAQHQKPADLLLDLRTQRLASGKQKGINAAAKSESPRLFTNHQRKISLTTAAIVARTDGARMSRLEFLPTIVAKVFSSFLVVDPASRHRNKVDRRQHAQTEDCFCTAAYIRLDDNFPGCSSCVL